MDELQQIMLQVLHELNEDTTNWKLEYTPGRDEIRATTEHRTTVVLRCRYTEKGTLEVSCEIQAREKAIAYGNLGIIAAALKRCV